VLHAALDFQDVQVAFGPEPHRFAALVPDAVGGALAGTALEGFHAMHAGSILTGMALPHGSDRPTHPPAPARGPT
jgi:hypothetical protein